MTIRTKHLLAFTFAASLALNGCGGKSESTKSPDDDSDGKQVSSKDNLKQIGVAMEKHLDKHYRWPTADSNGLPAGEGRRAGLSWRVYILPQLGQQKLYDQFKLDEPWNSKHNKKLIARMPMVFASTGSEELAKEGKSRLHVFAGKGSPFSVLRNGKSIGIRIRDLPDGTSNTLMVVEAGENRADIWTKPGGLPFDLKGNPVNALGKLSGEMFRVVMFDGVVGEIKKSIDPQVMKLLIQHQDRTPIESIPGNFDRPKSGEKTVRRKKSI